MTRRRRSWSWTAVGVLTLAITASWPDTIGAQSAEYRFRRVADSVADGFDPNNVGCAAINNSGQVAFRWGRVAEDGFNTVDGIYRADPGRRRLQTIAENEQRSSSSA